MKKTILFYGLIVGFLISSCDSGSEGNTDDIGGGTDDVIGGGDDDDPMTDDVPGAATLVFPDNNEECTEGVVVNDLESTITFQWQASENTDTYDINVTYLNSGVNTVTQSTTNEADITLERGEPYSWFVVSKSNTVSDTAVSDTWQFYNEGPGQESYAPFPAQVMNPSRGSTITGVSTTLEWIGSDVDNDITGYEVFFGTDADPTVSLGTTTQNSVNVTITAEQTYYWRIVTIDSEENTSQSEIFEFSVE